MSNGKALKVCSVLAMEEEDEAMIGEKRDGKQSVSIFDF